MQIQPEFKLPMVSIIIANLNGRRHLEQCLPSLLQQTYPRERIEIIVVDNGSQDDSVSFLRQEYPFIQILKNNKNEGFARANNQGVGVASGKYLALINNDMVAAPDWLEQLVLAQQKHQAACIGGVILNWDGTKSDFVDSGMTPYGFATQLHYGEPVEKLAVYAKEKPLLFACGGSLLIHREVFLKSGAFDEDFLRTMKM